MSELTKALVKLQERMPKIAKKKTAEITSQRTGKTHRYKYADLDDVSAAILPLLSSVGLAFIAKPTMRDGQFVLAYSLLHISGEREDGEYPLRSDGSAQELGSAITYARRYCLCAVTGASPDVDDDGHLASQPARPQRQPERPSKAVTRTRVTGADHERVRHGTVERTPDDRPADRTRGPIPDEANLWQDTQPNRAGLIVQHFNRLGVDDRDVRLGYTVTLAGRGVTSTKDLTSDEQKTLLDRLSRCRNRAALDELADKSREEVST